jgi:polyisoprenoid-binding protein YceI
MIQSQENTMLRSTLVLVLSTCATLQGVPRVVAGEMVLDLDPAQSEVSFTLPDVVHTVHGTFKLKGGAISFDPASGKATGEVIVDVSSGDSGSPARDRRMHKDILESSRYPTAIFALDHFDGQFGPDGSADLQVHGLFKIQGAEHEVTFPITATTHFVVPYVKWGMKNPSNFLLHVSDKVQIEIRATGHTHPAAG